MSHCDYLLDTNICIYITKQKPLSVLRKFESLTPGDVGMSIITYGELHYGAVKSNMPQKSESLLQELTRYILPMVPPENIANHYGSIRSFLEKQGQIIGGNDLWIAAHALAIDAILVTNNIKEFSRVPHLKIENWVNE